MNEMRRINRYYTRKELVELLGIVNIDTITTVERLSKGSTNVLGIVITGNEEVKE